MLLVDSYRCQPAVQEECDVNETANSVSDEVCLQDQVVSCQHT